MPWHIHAQSNPWFFENRPDLADLISHWVVEKGSKTYRLLSLFSKERLQAILKYVLDETEFLSEYGIRSLSRAHLKHPFEISLGQKNLKVSYEPAESNSRLFGGNSNWRGPIWFPINYLIIESLKKFYCFYGDQFKIEYPTGSKKYFNLKQISKKISERLYNIFLVDKKTKRRAVFGQNEKMQIDPNFKDHILFYEYFDGDNGRGIGASHQTGWTSLIANLFE